MYFSFLKSLIIFSLIILATGCGGGGSSSNSLDNNSDTNPPSIILNGNATILLDFGSPYIELGATANDDIDGAIAVTISGIVVTNIIGVYSVTYTAVDSAGNTSSVTRTISVVDNVAPSISLNGNSIIELDFGSPYIELGATAIDNADTNLSITTSGAVNINNIGSYEITYSVTDSSGNSNSAIRTINVVDNLAPSISLNGEASLIIYVNSIYTELGAVAIDNVDGNITPTISGNVNVNAIGTYQLTYSATDSNGNSGSEIREVQVIAPDYNFTLNDTDLTLWEGTYTHRFYFSFDQIEPVRKLLNISIASTSTATSTVDFELITTSLDEPENSEGSYIELNIIDDIISEGDEFIDLLIQDEDGNLITNIQILLDDQTSDIIDHNNLSGSHFAPSVSTIGDNLFITSSNRIERYDLISETTTGNAAFFPGIESNYSDAVTYEGDIYIFTSGKLYLLDQENFEYILISDAPFYLEWTSEIQLINNELYVYGGRDISGNQFDDLLIYNFNNQLWRTGGYTRGLGYGAASAISGNNLYIFGGSGSSVDIDIFDTTLNSWSSLPSSFIVGSFSSAVSLGQFIYVTSIRGAGIDEDSEVMRLNTLDSTIDIFTINTPARNYRDSFIYKGRIYLVGGTSTSELSSQFIVSYYLGD